MSEINKSFVQLNRTNLWLPRVQAKNAAVDVYTQFAMSVWNTEDMVALSYAYHNDFDPDITKELLDEETIQHLVGREFLTKSLGDIASRLTITGQVNVSMVVADLDEGTVSGHLVEPFVGKEIMSDLWGIYERNRKRPEFGLNNSFSG